MIEKKYYLFFIIPLLLFSSKWLLSYLIFPNDFLLTKVIIDTLDSQYYPIVKSLSELNLSPSYNSDIEAKKILAFPYGPIFLHSLFYKMFGNMSFIILEFVFTALFFITLFKIFEYIGFSFSSAICGSLLVLFLPTLSKLMLNFSIPYIYNIDNTLNYFYSTRFPRPQVTCLYYLVFICVAIKFIENIKANSNFFFATSFAILLGLLANSFFYFFIYCSLALLVSFIINSKKNIFHYLYSNYKFFLLFLFVLICFLITFFTQIYFSESDHSSRIGLVDIDMSSKIYLINYFLKSLLRPESIMIFLISLILTLVIKMYFNKDDLFRKVSIFYYLYLISLISPFLFFLISSKAIALYHFADYILVNGLIYIIISSLALIYFFIRNRFQYRFIALKKNIKYFSSFLIIILFFLNNYLSLKPFADRADLNNVHKILLDTNMVKTKLNLLTNDSRFANLWIFSNNENLVISDGYVNSLTDQKIEYQLIKGLKSLGLNAKDFKKIINFKGHNNRNPLTTLLFNYKYQANAFRQFATDQYYTNAEIDLIMKTSPLRVMQQIIPSNEKERLISKFKRHSQSDLFENDFLAIINMDIFPDILKNKNFNEFNILYKKDNIVFLKKK